MCLAEKKLYGYPDGGQRVEKTISYCQNSDGRKVCSQFRERLVQQANIVERIPSTSTTATNDHHTVTEAAGSRRKVYRDASNRSSNSTSNRRSTTTSSPISIPSSESSPPVIEPRRSVSSTREVNPMESPLRERTRAPYPPISPSQPSRTVKDDGTAVYDHPLSRPFSFQERRPSNSSTTAEVDNSQPPRSSPRRRRSVRVDTSTRQPPSVGPTFESPGLSSIPPSQDSAPTAAGPSRTQRRNSRRPHRRSTTDDNTRPRDEDRYQASLERERIAASERRQAEREELAARERHRQATTDALEGSSYQHPPPMDSIQLRAEAERRDIARERAEAEARRRWSDERAAAQMYADEEARRRYYSPRHSFSSARPSSRRGTGDSYAYSYATTTASPQPMSPISPRASMSRPIVHQQRPSAWRRESSSIAERGEQVIAREQARRATDRLSAAMGGLRVDDGGARYVDEFDRRSWAFECDDDEGQYVEEPYYGREDADPRWRMDRYF